MQNAELQARGRRHLTPRVACESLPPFDHTSIEEVRLALQFAVPIPLTQSWLLEEEPGFCPGIVRMGWRDQSLAVFAELTDADIFNHATGLNQRTWELGDVFEIFLCPANSSSYVELHVTPHNHRLQLRYPDSRAAEIAREMDRFEEYLVSHEVFRSVTWNDGNNGQWALYAEIPVANVTGASGPTDNAEWRFSFCRYEYTRGVTAPVISSTSPHSIPDFHRQHEWGVMTFKTRS